MVYHTISSSSWHALVWTSTERQRKCDVDTLYEYVCQIKACYIHIFMHRHFFLAWKHFSLIKVIYHNGIILWQCYDTIVFARLGRVKDVFINKCDDNICIFCHLYHHTCRNKLCLETCSKKILFPGWALRNKSFTTLKHEKYFKWSCRFSIQDHTQSRINLILKIKYRNHNKSSYFSEHMDRYAWDK